MEIKKIATENAPAAIGPYSQAVLVGNMLYTSGQIPINPGTGEIYGSTVSEQAEQVMKNLEAVLRAAGTGFENAVKTTCFLADMADFADFNVVYAKYFTTNPARSCVAVRSLPKGVLVEVEVIAAVPQERPYRHN
ncbi:MAG: RidA family protein [Clostridia bacterium]|nr:RidA family protein [Clostridia bacterium]